jgi:CRISPR-associated protein Cmr3
MNWTILEPRDPLLVRDGRPFLPGTEGARSLDFVPPSVTAGALRTRVWHAKGGWSVDEAKALPVQGPLLAELQPERDALKTLWLPAPRDCALFTPRDKAAGELDRFGLAPGAPFADGDCNLHNGLLPVVPVASSLSKEKPAKSAPAYWSKAILQAWLAAPAPSQDKLPHGTGQDHTRGPLQHEPRVHVALKPDGSRTGEDGKLFQTDGLRFAAREVRQTDKGEQVDFQRLALLVRCDHPELRPGALTLGGERRLTLMGALEGDPTWAAPPLSGARARVVLLTPGLFAEGSAPRQIGGARVIAAAVGRPQTLSGWDMAWKSSAGKVGGPKPTRRMAPAGSVYWVDLTGVDAKAWAAAVHFGGVCTEPQDNRDGFGLAVVGVSA